MIEEYKERLGRLMLYRNRIVEKGIREVEKDFPNMDVLAEELARLVEAIDEYDDMVVSVLSELGDKVRRSIAEKIKAKAEIEEEYEEIEEENEVFIEGRPAKAEVVKVWRVLK